MYYLTSNNNQIVFLGYLTIFLCQSWTNPSSSDVSVTKTFEIIIQVELVVHVTTPQAQGQSTLSDHEDHDIQAPYHITEASDQTCEEQGNREQEVTSHNSSEQS